jgi:ribosomal-protein-alanine N-acetyltransferase
MWKLLEPDTSQMIGFCGLQPLANTPDIEIGWWLAPSHWGCGLATEAARAFLRDGFERVGLQRIVAVAHPDNRASRRVMEKLGMQYQRDAQHKGIGVVLYAIHASKTPISSGT